MEINIILLCMESCIVVFLVLGVIIYLIDCKIVYVSYKILI